MIYVFDDGKFEFYTVIYKQFFGLTKRPSEYKETFRVGTKTTPEIVARQLVTTDNLNPEYTYCRQSSKSEINYWMRKHREFHLKHPKRRTKKQKENTE